MSSYFSYVATETYSQRNPAPNHAEQVSYSGSASSSGGGYPIGLKEYSSANYLTGTYIINPFASVLKLADFVNGLASSSKGQGSGEVASGQGELRTSQGILLYQGFWAGGLRSGKGQAPIYIQSGNNVRYEGQYNGEWKFGFRDGFGILSRDDGSEYEGEWKYDRKFGRGSESFLDGSRFVGVWHADERHGVGRFYWGNGMAEDREYDHGRIVRVCKLDSKQGKEITKIGQDVEALKKGSGIKAPEGGAQAAVSAAPAPAMGGTPQPGSGPVTLPEKRILKSLKDELVPKIENDIKGSMGKAIRVDVDWVSFECAKDGKIAVWMLQNNDGLFTLQQVSRAFGLMAQDKLSKETVVESIEKVRLVNKATVRETQVTIANKTLEIVGAFEIGTDSKLDAVVLKNMIENKL